MFNEPDSCGNVWLILALVLRWLARSSCLAGSLILAFALCLTICDNLVEGSFIHNSTFCIDKQRG
ncbi:hypothetical protein T10_2142 [Trichinella papuae]|uniref:Uncharacterized protein n=1 Tax=Trichinella papuae TaxID=268474 RepID=A0A0V1N3Z8_9BILA|nr:hypothetical protein T10_2142 [Trichinella papuae]